MCPVAAYPGTKAPAQLNRDAPAKGSAPASHDASDQADTSPTGTRPASRNPIETSSVVALPSPSRFSQSDQRRTRTAPNNVPTYDSSAAVKAGRELQHAVEPVLSERDSIFATHYTGGNTPTASPKIFPVKHYNSGREQEGTTKTTEPDMAVPMPRRLSWAHSQRSTRIGRSRLYRHTLSRKTHPLWQGGQSVGLVCLHNTNGALSTTPTMCAHPNSNRKYWRKTCPRRATQDRLHQTHPSHRSRK